MLGARLKMLLDGIDRGTASPCDDSDAVGDLGIQPFLLLSFLSSRKQQQEHSKPAHDDRLRGEGRGSSK